MNTKVANKLKRLLIQHKFELGLPGLYRVNVRTGVTTRVIEEERRSFNLADVPRS